MRRHERVVRGFLARVAGPARADDLAQETFLSAWSRAGSYSGEGSYRGWLLRIAWRSFLMEQRTGSRRIPAGAGDGPERAGSDDPERRLMVEDALARLDEKDRAAVILCHVLGHSHAEAAAILDSPLGTLKSRVARGTRRLLEMLGDGDGD